MNFLIGLLLPFCGMLIALLICWGIEAIIKKFNQ